MGSTVFGDFIFKDFLDRAILNSMKEFRVNQKVWDLTLTEGSEYPNIWVNIFNTNEAKA